MRPWQNTCTTAAASGSQDKPVSNVYLSMNKLARVFYFSLISRTVITVTFVTHFLTCHRYSILLKKTLLQCSNKNRHVVFDVYQYQFYT